jgi:medium-chain acyl-[acyl-carrier-protein] hydrolase
MNPSSWFVCPQPNPGANLRLFLFPYAGGGPAAFGKWPAEFPDMIETWIAHYPGRGSRHKEPALKQIAALEEGLTQALRPFLEKPFAFFGHSLGGLVAFELARRLHQENLPQSQVLFLSACVAPHLPVSDLPIHTLPDRDFLKALQALDGIPSEVANFPELIDLLLPTLRADFEAVETYHFRSNEPAVDCPIVAFGGIDDRRVRGGHLKAWARYTSAGFKLQYFPGDHFFLNTSRSAMIASMTTELKAVYARD